MPTFWQVAIRRTKHDAWQKYNKQKKNWVYFAPPAIFTSIAVKI
jgi:hypothetical protein